MGQKRDRRRLPEHREHRHRDQVLSRAGDPGAAPKDPICPHGILLTLKSGTPARYQVLAVCGGLLLAVGFVFGQTVRYEFINFDDGGYVAENPYISGGLTARGIAWVFTHSHEGNWHPLTGLTHMLDCQFYGLNPERTTWPMSCCTPPRLSSCSWFSGE